MKTPMTKKVELFTIKLKKKAPRNGALTCREAEINRLQTAIFQVLRPVNEKEMMAYVAKKQHPKRCRLQPTPITPPLKAIILMKTTLHRNQPVGGSVLWKEHSNL